MQSIEAARRLPARFFLAICVALAVALVACAEDVSLGQKLLPKADDVVAMLGQSLATTFDKFGAPSDLTVEDPDSKSPSVNMDYGKFTLELVSKPRLLAMLALDFSWIIAIFPTAIRF